MKTSVLALFGAVTLTLISAQASEKKGNKPQGKDADSSGPALLWLDPGDITSRDLYFGPGGQADQPQPQGRFTFVEEDMDGSNPKFVARDEDGVKWKVKMGIEARPETAASRLVWAVGYFTNEDYFLSEIKVDNLPPHLHRGQEFVTADGTVHDVRLKRYLKGEKKIGQWNWDANPFSGTTQLNGLRALMALINNWDLKEENNSVYRQEMADGSVERVYMVSDLGASFGAPRMVLPLKKSRGDLNEYGRSKFFTATKEGAVNFVTPSTSWFPYIFNLPEYSMRVGLRHIGRDIPRADALWLGQLMARLSHSQICDAFRAAGYSPEEVEGFAGIVEQRIAELNSL